MKRLIIILMFLSVKVSAYAQKYEFKVWVDYPTNTTYKISSATYKLSGAFGVLNQTNGIFNVSSPPSLCTIDLILIENNGGGDIFICIEIWQTSLSTASSCYSLKSLDNQDCTPGSQTYDVFYSLKPTNLTFGANSTPEYALANGPLCVDEPVQLVAVSGFNNNSYYWHYRVENGNWISFNPGDGNDVSFMLQSIIGSVDASIVNKSIYFTYTIGNCTDYSNSIERNYVFSVLPPKIKTIDKSPVSCFGGNDGEFVGFSLDRPLIPGEEIISELVDSVGDPVAPPSYANLEAGRYTLQLFSNIEYCDTFLDILSFDILDGNEIGIDFINQQGIVCYNETSGEVTISARGGSGIGYQYAKDDLNYSSSPIISGLGSGDNIIYVKDSKGCTSSKVVAIDGPPNELTGNISSITNPSCVNSFNGSVSLVGAGGYGGYIYSENDSLYSSVNSYTGLTTGTHTFWIKDSGGCKVNLQVTLTAPSEIIIDNISITPPQCAGKDATLGISATGGNGLLEYSLDNSNYQSFAEFHVLAGTYNVYVRDENSCIADTLGIIIQDTQPITYQTAVTAVSCNGGNNGIIDIVNVTNGLPPYQYSLNGVTFASVSTFYNIEPGSYNITVKDSQGCLSSTLETLDNPTSISGVITESPILCNGSSTGELTINGSGGSGNLRYLWFNGDTLNRVGGLSAGTYNVKIFDQNNCESNLIEYVLEEPDEIIITPLRVDNNGFDVSCFDGNDGVIDLLVTGGVVSSSYSYSWSTGDVGSSLINAVAGQYSVEVTDDNGCNSISLIDLTSPPQLTFSEVLTSDVTCNGENNGTVQVKVTGGVGGYQYAIDAGNFGIESTFIDVQSGGHIIYASDLNNCLTSENILIAEPAIIDVLLIGSSNTLCGQANGSIDIDVIGGIEPYSYVWTDDLGNLVSSVQDLTNVTGGNYMVSVLDANTCLQQASFSVSDSDGPQIIVDAVVGTSCFDSSDGSATISITGGVAPYTINWQNGVSTLAASNLPAGNINVQVTDASGCVSFKEIIVPGKTPIELTNIQLSKPKCYGDENGSINLNVFGGVAPYSITWSNGIEGEKLDNIPAGNYGIFVIDANGCSFSETIELEEPDEIMANLLISKPTCSNKDDASVLIEPFGGTQPYEYYFAGDPATSLIQDLSSGTYSLQIIDANACSYVTSITIDNAEPLSLDIENMVICEGQTIELTSPMAGIAYQWFLGEELLSTSETISIEKEGDYFLEVVNAEGCVANGSFTITTSSDVLNGDFLMSSTAYAGDTVIIIDITYPIPDSSNWVIPKNTDIIELTNDLAMLVFVDPGTYEIGFESYLGRCYDYYSSSIEIKEAIENSADGRIVRDEVPLILSMMVYPNPNDGVFTVEGELSIAKKTKLRLVNLLTNQILSETVSDEDISHTFNVNLPGLSPGNYAIVLEAAGELKIVRMIKR